MACKEDNPADVWPKVLQSMMYEVWTHSHFLTDRLPVMVVIACCIVVYIIYGIVMVVRFELSTIPVKLSLFVEREIHPLCAICAGGCHRYICDQYDFSFYSHPSKPTRVRFFNSFFSQPVDLTDDDETAHEFEFIRRMFHHGQPLSSDPSGINHVAIHACGGIRVMSFELASLHSSTELLCLPSPDYENILLEQLESYFLVDPHKWKSSKLRFFGNNAFVARGFISLSRNDHMKVHIRADSSKLEQ